MATAQEIARYIVCFFQEAGDPVSNLKLQKLIYYVQGWHIALREGRPAFDDRLEAWTHGPVHPGVYRMFKDFRWSPITVRLDKPSLDEGLKEVVDTVLAVYGSYSGFELESLTHDELPWLEAREGLPPDAESHNVLLHKTMRQFFAGLQLTQVTVPQ